MCFHNLLYSVACSSILESSSHCSVFKVRAPTFSKVRFQYPTPTLGTEIRSYKLVGQSGLEPPTSRLSVVCSSQLSYWPACHAANRAGRKSPKPSDSAKRPPGTLSPLAISLCSRLSPFAARFSALRGGGYRTRTGDPLLAKQVLYQLS